MLSQNENLDLKWAAAPSVGPGDPAHRQQSRPTPRLEPTAPASLPPATFHSNKFHITTPPIPRMLKVLKFAFSTKFWAFQTYPQTRPPSSPWWTTIRGCSPPSSCMPWPSSLSGFLWFRISSLVQDQQIQVEERNDRLSDLRRAGRRLLQ